MHNNACMNLLVRLFFCFGFLITVSSCAYTYQYTYTKKSGIKQLLVTKAVDEAIQGMAVDVRGSKVFVEVACLMKDEQSYIKSAFVHRFLDSGGSITENRPDADYVVSILVRVAGTDGDQFTLGLPSIPVPLALPVPSFTIFSGIVQKGRVEMEVVLYGPNGGLKEKIPSLKGESYYKKYVILFVSFTSKDIP